MADVQDRPITCDELRALVRRTYAQPVVSLYLALGRNARFATPPST
jgi:hypothetical protein